LIGKVVYRKVKEIYVFVTSLFLLVINFNAPAQNTDPLIYTVGKVFQTDTDPKAYILWQPGNFKSTFGKQFAVYRKQGNPNSLSPYALLGRTKLQTSPGAVKALLKLGSTFDIDAQFVAERINTIYAESLSQDVSEFGPSPLEPGNSEAERLTYLLGAASENEKTLQRIAFLGRTHPGIFMSMGHSYAVNAKAQGAYTYEVREINAQGKSLRVIGRVTLDPEQTIELERPSRPYQVFYEPNEAERTSARDHLVARMRWGMPDELRRLLPHTFGFNLYRVTEAKAIERGWHLEGAFPEINTMLQLVEESDGDPDPQVTIVNKLPVFAGKLMTEEEAADSENETETFFTHDDKEAPANPFTDGETFYYFVSARDIAGYPGLISSGTKVVICDRIPPKAPVIESVSNVFTSESIEALENQKGNQHFRLRIHHQLQEDSEQIKKYYIYRWEDNTQHLRDGGNWENNLVAEISEFDPDSLYLDWDDDLPESPRITPNDDSQVGRSWWYTVRAVDSSSCVPGNLSGHSSPAFGVLRDRSGPGRSSGLLSRCVVNPSVRCDELTSERIDTLGLKSDFYGFVLRLNRNDELIRSVDFNLEYRDQILFSSSRNFVVSNTINVPITLSRKISISEVVIKVRSRISTGYVSEWVSCDNSKTENIKGEVAVISIIAEADMEYRPVKVQSSGSLSVPHDVIGIAGRISGPRLNFTIPEGSKEYRIYRRVGDDGAFQLLDRGSANDPDFPAELPGDIQFTDPAPPTESGVEVCYFVQVFDQDGNPGPRVKIGCVLIRSNDIAAPMLYDPEYLVQNEDSGQLRLKWFCDPVGVKRFEIWSASESSANPQLESILISPELGSIDGASIGPSSPISDLSFTGYQTKTVSSGQIGEGAEFSIKVSVPSNQALFFSVRAVGDGPYVDQAQQGVEPRISGPFSNTVQANWTPSPQEIDGVNIIPWPALAVPGIASVNALIDKYQPGEGPFYASSTQQVGSALILMGAMNSLRDEKNGGAGRLEPGRDPLSILFSFRKQNIHPVLPNQLDSVAPFVVYRHQLPTNGNPDVVPNLVQVSPLIDRISFKDYGNFREIRDPFFVFVNYEQANEKSQFRVPLAGTFSRDLKQTQLGSFGSEEPLPNYLSSFNTLVYWVDRMPVVSGARYQYLIVHFTDYGEIDRVIPTNFVDQP